MERKYPTFRSERKKRSTSGGSPQFPNGFSGKLLLHLTFNRNFRIFWLEIPSTVSPGMEVDSPGQKAAKSLFARTNSLSH